MPKNNFINLDVDNLFEEHSIDEIITIKKLLDADIEKKRNDLRCMVGDRYKEILVASDSIKSMQTISEEIVNNIELIIKISEKLTDSQTAIPIIENSNFENPKYTQEERTLLIQVRLAIFLNEQIWLTLDNENNLDATKFYLLAQHIYMGLQFSNQEYLKRLTLLEHLQLNLKTLKSIIFSKITNKLQLVDLTAEETTHNLNALVLLENQTNDQLISIFIEHRKTALQTVIESQYSNIRVQVAAMVKCLVTTVLLLHDCFIHTENKKGLIWQELYNTVGENAPPILSNLELPVSPLIRYIPDIIKQFKPKLLPRTDVNLNNKETVSNWLKSTQKKIEVGLKKSLILVTTIKGLFLIREEALKVEKPNNNWSIICQDLGLPENFDIWSYFFQELITLRAETLISQIIANCLTDIKSDITSSVKNVNFSDKSELDLRWYVWNEESSDISKIQNDHTGLTMKTKGFSQAIVKLCKNFDTKFFSLLEDVSQYFYGEELNPKLDMKYLINDKFNKKFIDRDNLSNHLRIECTKQCLDLPNFVKGVVESEPHLLAKSLLGARFLQGCCFLCPSFRKCCEFNNIPSDWLGMCDVFLQTSYDLWINWINNACNKTKNQVKLIGDTSLKNMVETLVKWEEIDIQEQTEEKIFKSQIKIPSKPSTHLTNILVKLNQTLCSILPYTLPKTIHIQFIESNMDIILKEYEHIASQDLNQIQALQFLFDLRFLTTLCVPRENTQMVSFVQNVCDKLRSKIDPFDLDVFYLYLQDNVRRAVHQSQSLFGCLLPSSTQIMNLGSYNKVKEQEKNPSLMALSSPSVNAWFPLLPVTAPSQKHSGVNKTEFTKPTTSKPTKSTLRKTQDHALAMRQGAVSLFENLTTDWFS